jgi:hypothetical protein
MLVCAGLVRGSGGSWLLMCSENLSVLSAKVKQFGANNNATFKNQAFLTNVSVPPSRFKHFWPIYQSHLQESSISDQSVSPFFKNQAFLTNLLVPFSRIKHFWKIYQSHLQKSSISDQSISPIFKNQVFLTNLSIPTSNIKYFWPFYQSHLQESSISDNSISHLQVSSSSV